MAMWRRRLPSGNRPSATRSMLAGSVSRVFCLIVLSSHARTTWRVQFQAAKSVARRSIESHRFIVYFFPYLSRQHPKISKGVRAHSVAGLLEKRRNKFGGAEPRSGAAESASVPEIHHGDERKFQLRERHQRTVVPQPAPSYQTGSLFQQGSASSSIPRAAIISDRNSFLTLEKAESDCKR